MIAMRIVSNARLAAAQAEVSLADPMEEILPKLPVALLSSVDQRSPDALTAYTEL